MLRTLALLLVTATSAHAVSLEVTPKSVPAGQAVTATITGSGTAPGSTVVWDWGDGQRDGPTADAFTQTHVYATPGTYGLFVQTTPPTGTAKASASTKVEVTAATGATTSSATTSSTAPGTPTTSTSTAAVPTSSTTSSTTTAGVTTTTVPGPGILSTRMPVAKDISIRLRRDDTCHWWDVWTGTPRTASQTERAEMYLYGVAQMMAEGLAYAKEIPACLSIATGKSLSDYETENLRLRVFYVDPLRDSSWEIGSNGCPDYAHVANLGVRLQACSTSKDAAAQACAASFRLTGEILDWADLRIENGRCVKGARYTLTVPKVEDEDKALARRGFLDYRKPLPALTPAQRAAATRVMTLHHQASLAKCGDGTAPASGAVKAAELAFLQSASTEEQKHAFLMIFTPLLDEGPTGWTAQDVCDFAMLQHHAWHAWDQCLDLPGAKMWGCLTRARVSHETVHLMAAFRSPKPTRYRLGDHSGRLMDFPAQTVDQWLACLRAPGNRCGLTWVPADWRVMLGATPAM